MFSWVGVARGIVPYIRHYSDLIGTTITADIENSTLYVCDMKSGAILVWKRDPSHFRWKYTLELIETKK